jgi:hypothetical protein
MTERSEAPGAVEGDEVLVVGKKIVPSGRPQRLIATDMIVFCIDVREPGEATIIRRCPQGRPPLKPYSMLNEGDKISGKKLTGLMTYPLAPDDYRVGGAGRTGSHPRQELYIARGCFMEIVSGWRGDPLAIHPKEALLA